MMPNLGVSAALISLSMWPIWAAASSAVDTASASPMVGNEPPAIQQYFIHHSHKFNMEPRAVMSSVLSDLRRHLITHNDDGTSSLLDIDVSSTRLGDNASASLIEELMQLLKTKNNSEDEYQVRAPILVKLGLAMNNLTPLGASKIFDMLMMGDATKEITGGTIHFENGNVDEIGSRSKSLINELNNETMEQNVNTTSSDGLNSTDTSTAQVSEKPSILIEELDLSFNDIGGHGVQSPNSQLQDSVRRLFEGEGAAFFPRLITLENCGIGPSFCRSVGRGILNSFERLLSESSIVGRHPDGVRLGRRPTVLRIGGNNAIGDAGTVALAAALRMATESESGSHVILDELDLSSCNVGDVGAEALALAIASNPNCLRQLDLSNNKITDTGARALGRALMDARHGSGAVFEKIILDNNVGICDDGAAALAEALGCGAVKSVSLRSCSVQAQGTSSFGRALVSLVNHEDASGLYCVDVSGNHFGNRKIFKKKGTANLIRDRASTNIKFIGKTLKGAAKRFGSETMGITADSDDDEEVMGGLIDDEVGGGEDGDKIQACGGHAFAGELITSNQPTMKKLSASPLKISIGMRQCLLDDGAIDALSASIIAAKNFDLSIDVSMNFFDDAIVDELLYPEKDSTVLASMAERHMDYMNRIADSRKRQLEAVESAAARRQNIGSFFDDGEFSEEYFE
ncbi:hypothetical protein ACHAW5_008987 [Stephanodiscus triporus]|uniref:Uncharacterized protein n=1 Tax=Stephanodiscus triporus TaxID=2934178 RepID=A0ABD3PHL7_9STRA